MMFLSWLRHLARHLFRPAIADRQLDEEMQSSLQLLIDERVSRGADPADARRAALLELGGLEQVKEEVRDHRPGAALDHVMQDLRYAARMYRKSPGFTSAVVVTLALGIGASTAIFSVVNGILLRPLPFPEPDRLLWINEVDAHGGLMSVSWPNYLDWRARTHAFDILAANRPGTMTVINGGPAERVPGRRVTAGFFQALGVNAAQGRLFTEADDAPDAPPAAIVTHGYATRHAQSAAAPGAHLTVDGVVFTVVGTLPAGFSYVRDEDVYLAMGAFRAEPPLQRRGDHAGYSVLARPRPGVAIEVATQELAQIEASLSREHPATNAGVGAFVQRLSDRVVGDIRPTLWMLFGAVGLLLAIACVNVANLLIARGVGRQHELALRAALGGGRARLIRQLLVENSLLSIAGGALGLVLAVAFLRLLIAVAPAGTPRIGDVGIDRVALLFALGTTALCGIAFGAFPALQASRARATELVIRQPRAGSSGRHHRVRSILVVSQVAIALVLVTGAMLMMQTMAHLAGVDAGFDPRNVTTMKISMRGDRWDKPARVAAADQILARASVVPGISSVAAVSDLPLEGSTWNSVFSAEGIPPPARREDAPSATISLVSPGYFGTMGVQALRGRLLNDHDVAASSPVVVINATMARRLWPGENPIGKRYKRGWPETVAPWCEIVGVVGDVKVNGVTEAPGMQVYMPFAQDPPDDFALVIRTAGETAGIVKAIETAVHDVSADLPVSAVKPMSAVFTGAIERERMAGVILILFASIALTLAIVGLYGLLLQDVTERRHEISIRMALGADRVRILKLIVTAGCSLVAIGAAIGVMTSLAVSRSLDALLFGVTPRDTRTIVAAALLLLAVGVVACAVPSYRAMRIQPSEALKT